MFAVGISERRENVLQNSTGLSLHSFGANSGSYLFSSISHSEVDEWTGD